MEIAVLGPLEVRDDAGTMIDVAGARVRTLLARLAIDAGRAVSLSALVDAVWADRPPADETNALQTLVSRLRRALGDPGAIVQSQAGYRLVVDPARIDAHRFERLAAAGSDALRRGELEHAARTLAEALELWRGPALADALESGDALVVHAARLDDLRLAAVVERIEAELQLGAPGAVAELEALVTEHPLDERLTGQLMQALAGSGRQADALHAYERLRGRLADELGVDPGGKVQEVHLAVLRGELAAAAPARSRRTNLKAQLTSFVGREDEVARIGKLLEQYRLVTLVGPGGAGKTRLASEAAAQVVDSAADGIWLVELAPVTSGADVPQAVLNSLGLREMHILARRGTLSTRDALTRLHEGLADKHAVLVLDNCEHLIDASARLADQLLADCPHLRILVTSREPLGIVGEVLLAVPPLDQPNPAARTAEAFEYPAVRLFADRAAAVRPDFELDDRSVASVIEIVRRLDGLPLAIELAAARLRTLPLSEIAARLSDRFRLLTGGSRTALPRHRTLRAVVEWSWDLLTPDERRLAEQLSAFPSGITVDSAGAVADADPGLVPDLLASLIDKSLLHQVDGGRRLRMLETIREYGAERLGERGELGAVRARHADHFAALMTEAETHLTRADQAPWFSLLADERDNILAAMRYRCDIGDADGALRLALGLASYAMMLGNHGEISTWMSDALDVPGGLDHDLRLIATAVHRLNSAASGTSTADVEGGLADLRSLARQLGEIRCELTPFVALIRPVIAFFANEPELVERYGQQVLDGPSDWARAAVHMFRATVAENEGDVATMRAEIEIALRQFRELGERWGLASTLRCLAQLSTLDGDLDAAIVAYREALALSTELQSRDDEGFLLGRLADLELRRGDIVAARRYVLDAKASADEHGEQMESLFTLAMLGAVEQASGNQAEAKALIEEALERVETMPLEHPAQSHIRAVVLGVGSRLAFEENDTAAARELADGAYRAAVSTRDLPVIASVGVAVAKLVAGDGDPERAAVMLGAARRLRGSADSTARDIVELTTELRSALGAERFDAAVAQGEALDRAAAIERLAPS